MTHFYHLDYSFTPEHEDGSARAEDPTPGGGGRELRKRLGILKRFLERFDLVNAAANNEFVLTTVPDRLRSEIRAISDQSCGFWAIYVPRGPRITLALELPSRLYRIEWIDPRDGKVLKAEDLDARGRITSGVVINSPDYTEDVAVRITTRDSRE